MINISVLRASKDIYLLWDIQIENEAIKQILLRKEDYTAHQGTHAMAYHLSLVECGGISSSMGQQIPLI